MTFTITSKSKISYNDILHVAKQASDIMFEFAETKTEIVYRRLLLHNDNLSGDLEKSSYIEYEMGVIVTPLLLDDRIIKSGEMKPGDVELFIKPYINSDINGTIIPEPFEPKIDDEFWFQGIRYRIKLVRAERIGNTKVYLDCLCSRIENNNPDHEWNSNYRQPVQNGRRGSGWD